MWSLNDRALLFGAPAQVVHGAVGNCSNTRLLRCMNRPEVVLNDLNGLNFLNL